MSPEAIEARVLSAVRMGGGRFRRVVFTRNRRVMASVGDGGATLRLHEAFREAPEDVLRSVGLALARPDRPAASGARDRVRAFLSRSLTAAPPTPRPRPYRPSPADRA